MRRSAHNLAAGVSQTLALLAVVYVALVFLYELPFLSTPNSSEADENIAQHPPPSHRRRSLIVSSLDFGGLKGSVLATVARDSWEVGLRLLDEMDAAGQPVTVTESIIEVDNCPNSIVLSGKEFEKRGRVMGLPCGLALGSQITIVGRPGRARPVNGSKIGLRGRDGAAIVSQFVVELLGLRRVDGEEAPRILHFNPRLKGDWSGKQVIEMNTCYRMQWGYAQRCEGWKSRSDEETVDGLLKCESWINSDNDSFEKLKMTWWLKQLIGPTKRISIDWPFPFVEDKLFIMTLRAGLEGYHVNVDGRHVTSFPYRLGFILEDASRLLLNGDVEIQSIFAGSLPAVHPSFASQKHQELLVELQAPPVPDGPVELFIGILSSPNNFAERMAIRKSWISTVRKSLFVVARFFVALNGRNEVNVDLKKEAEFYKDIVIVPFMDSYDLVVLKTIAICEYGVHVVSAKYIMKCDDDTFIRIESVLDETKKVPSGKSLYAGNINYYHKPLREGKWAVTYEEWPEEYYPPYANGPGYVLSSDIAYFIISEFEKHKLRLFKMEDVSMGMWVEQFNKTRTVDYIHNLKFCQFGCIDDYYTAHYQSPRQMSCLWEKLQSGKPQCCDTM